MKFDELVKTLSKLRLERAGRLGDGQIRVHCSILVDEVEFYKFRKLFSESEGGNTNVEDS